MLLDRQLEIPYTDMKKVPINPRRRSVNKALIVDESHFLPLMGMTMKAAADSMEVSVTALKNACKKLDIVWPKHATNSAGGGCSSRDTAAAEYNDYTSDVMPEINAEIKSATGAAEERYACNLSNVTFMDAGSHLDSILFDFRPYNFTDSAPFNMTVLNDDEASLDMLNSYPATSTTIFRN